VAGVALELLFCEFHTGSVLKESASSLRSSQ
jgi:hypothetical protein